MTLRISPVLCLCVAVSGGCSPKQNATLPRPDDALASDTARPPVPTSFAPPRDSTRTVAVPDDPAVRYHRHLVGVVFDDSTSGTTINSLLRKYAATIVGGLPHWGAKGAYILQFPDTVTTYEGLQGLIRKIDGEPGVDFGFGTTWRDKIVPRDR